jgi:hypothetical protein
VIGQAQTATRPCGAIKPPPNIDPTTNQRGERRSLEGFDAVIRRERGTVRAKSAASSLALALAASGCAIHPQPRDVTGVPTFEIVQRIRCETRQSVIALTLTYASKKGDSQDQATAARLSAEFDANPKASTKLSPNLFGGDVRKNLNTFWTTGVAYNFKLDMTEVNNADGSLNIGSLFGRRLFGVALTAGLDRTRENTRTFTVTDNFGELVKSLTGCEDELVGPNYIYPITGRIGVQDMIEAFVYMSIFANLGAETTTPATVPKGPPTLVDALQFTTKISGSVNPTVAFSPVGKELGVTAAGVDLVASRTDLHEVTVGLALGPAGQAQLGSLREAYFGSYVGAPGALVAPLLTAAPTTRSEAFAAAAVKQFLTQQLFSPTINLTP